MKLNFALLGVLFFCASSCLAYNIKTDDFNIKTDEFSVIQKEVKNIARDTLVVFDIDWVLLESKDQILKGPNRPYYEEILGRYSYIMRNNTADQLSDEQLKNEIKKAIDRGVLTRNAYLYQYNTDTNVLRCLYIQESGKVNKTVRIMTANNSEDLAKIIGGLGLPATTKNEFRRLAPNKVKIIIAKTSAQIFEKFNAEEKTTEAESKNEEKRQLEAKNIESILMSQSQEVPVDSRMVDLIKHLQLGGIKVLALSSNYTGSYGRIASMEAWRINRLKQSGYTFDKSLVGVKDKLLDRFLQNTPGESIKPKQLEKKGVVFSKGVILTNYSPKGDALMAFLRYANIKPKKIIFIDDQRRNLKSVEAEARKNNIQFLGIEYAAVKDARLEPLNIKRARLQLGVFKEKQKWFSDEEADKYILAHSKDKIEVK